MAPNSAKKEAGMSAAMTDKNLATIEQQIAQACNPHDTAKAQCAVALLNTFNMAVQNIGGRQHWTIGDYMAYGTALQAMNAIRHPMAEAVDE